MTLDLGNQRQIEGLTVFGDDSSRNSILHHAEPAALSHRSGYEEAGV